LDLRREVEEWCDVLVGNLLWDGKEPMEEVSPANSSLGESVDKVLAQWHPALSNLGVLHSALGAAIQPFLLEVLQRTDSVRLSHACGDARQKRAWKLTARLIDSLRAALFRTALELWTSRVWRHRRWWMSAHQLAVRDRGRYRRSLAEARRSRTRRGEKVGDLRPTNTSRFPWF
jgi:hypothetical protein